MGNTTKTKVVALAGATPVNLNTVLPTRTRRIEFWPETAQELEVRDSADSSYIKHPEGALYDSGWFFAIREDNEIEVKGTGNLYVRYTT